MTSRGRRLLFFIISFFLFFSSSTEAGSTLTPSEPLADGHTLVSSPNRTFELGFFSPLNSSKRYVGIWYRNVPLQTVVWVANRKRAVADRHGRLSITAGGALVITEGNSSIVWTSSSPASQGLANPVAQLLDDGNFVVKDAAAGNGGDQLNGTFAWQSFDYPTDTLLPGMKFGVDLRTGLNRNTTAWTSASDPAPSEYTAVMDVHGYPQISLWQGSGLLWRSGPWNGQKFSGLRVQPNLRMFVLEFVANADEVYYRFTMQDPSTIYKITLNQSGVAEGLIWIEDSKIWNAFWSAPSDQCDAPAPCGPNGICDPNEWPTCECPPGFSPKNPTNWALRDGSDGCSRKTAVDCRNGTDGFMTVSGVKLPDTSSSWVSMSLNLGHCRAKCLSNCTCTAYASANVSSGIGCIFWDTDLTGIRTYKTGGQDLYVRLAAADLAGVLESKRSGHKDQLAVILASLASGVVALALLILFVWRKSDIIKGISSRIKHSKDSKEEQFELPLFDFYTISDATNNFSHENMIGEGGFGTVFQGKLADGLEIAVKRLSSTSLQGLDEFKNEVTLIAKLQHRNLVRLLGCCIDRGERMLVYEYMPYKSLDNFLFGKHKTMHLDWDARYNIIASIARGLLYLHQDSRYRIIHRDLKASNVLLDKDLNPKISDFGLARIFGGSETVARTTKVVGTYGYMSPEYAMDGIFSVKSDVFSFGVLVLEIISGQRNRGVYLADPRDCLLCNAWNLWNEGRSLELIDPSIGLSFSESQVMRCTQVGLLCIQEYADDRPTMSTVVIMLGTEDMVLPKPKRPGFVARRVAASTTSSTTSGAHNTSSASKRDVHSVNDLTLSMTAGR